MKKFCNKISKQQWRVTVPNVAPPAMFRRSPTNVSDIGTTVSMRKRVNSGSYDLVAAQQEYDVANPIPRAVLFDTESSSENDVSEFVDAIDSPAVTDVKNEVQITAASEADLYAQVDKTGSCANGVIVSKALTNSNTKYEYDVPRISFSFFESFVSGSTTERDYEVINAGTTNTVRRRSELTIILANPEVASTSSTSNSSDVYYSNKDMSHIKAGSVPNVAISIDEENFYKVPKPRLQYRLSKSLHDFTLENVSEASSIEHISCSQVIPQDRNSVDSDVTTTAANPASLEYCKARSKLPRKIRRVTLLRRPRSKALDTWTNIKSKINKILDDQQQDGNSLNEHTKVTGFGEKEKLLINIEEMYKNSKNKCKQMVKATGKMLKRTRRPDQENVDPNGETASTIVKNDAFFAKVELKAKDIQYKFDSNVNISEAAPSSVTFAAKEESSDTASVEQQQSLKHEFDFNTLRTAFIKRSRFCLVEGQNGFDDLRRYVKQGSDFCKELSVILQERSDTELTYAKSLSKLSGKLTRACRDGVGDLNEAWRAIALELDARAEAHRLIGAALMEEIARPLKVSSDGQQRLRKQTEAAVDKAGRGLAEWRAAEAKGKKHSHGCARENEKLQDALLDNRLSRSTSLIQLPHIQKNSTDKETSKLEGKKRKAEDAVKKADIEYYTLCVRAERARLEWESAVLRGAGTFQTLEDERLANLKSTINAYYKHCTDLGPRLIEATDRLKVPVELAEPTKDLSTFINLRQSSQQISEQLLPDFYCEHITLAMNRERRKQALIKLLHLIRQDVERERKSKVGLENLSKAIRQTPNFGAEDSQQSVTEKLYHMKSMLTYLEGARYKVQSALAELDSRPRIGHPLAPHIAVTRDKSGLQQSILKVPQWLRDQWTESEKSPVSEKSIINKSDDTDLPDPDWNNRGTADGNSNQPESDFDEFSSQGSSNTPSVCSPTTDRTHDLADIPPPLPNTAPPMQPVAQCKALYAYTPNLPDELTLRPGDILQVYRQQEDGWWLGECNGSVGIFPATYVETITTNGVGV